ncbi:unnamed protein product [Albugo candida]|uniref:Uncharacterized protein n=1 Tax=Albugo candida TaxID=65357 RepID=A0A024FSY1_9STRA|nr:unnamed protein product [Albugo candida]|eukprot:CCI10158.1 unnamed protein product [Albugo candida]
MDFIEYQSLSLSHMEVGRVSSDNSVNRLTSDSQLDLTLDYTCRCCSKHVNRIFPKRRTDYTLYQRRSQLLFHLSFIAILKRYDEAKKGSSKLQFFASVRSFLFYV